MSYDSPPATTTSRSGPTAAPVSTDPEAVGSDGSAPPAGSRARRCRICDHVGEAEWYEVREMMFGWRDGFRYFRCASCGCLQISEFPPDISRFYPSEYYSFDKGPERYGPLRLPFVRARNRYALSRRGWLGRWVTHEYPYPGGEIGYWLSRAGVSRESRILDVGCGSGELLYDLAVEGYANLLGADPHIRSDLEYPVGARILKRDLRDIDGRFELVMFHHSLEHIPDQLETIRAATERLERGGHCLIRVPVTPSYAWERYGEDWIQLDAPRHFFIHSIRSLELLGARAGLRLVEVRHDSTELQFVGSELYRRGIPLIAGKRHFSRRQRMRFRKLARRMNAEGRGDQAAFLFARD